jgi:hypothetical protein
MEDRKQMIVDVLVQRAQAHARSDGIAERSLWLWQRVAIELIPLVGEVGFQSLYARAVHLSLPHCTGFSLSARDSAEGVFQQLKEDLARLECDIAEKCSTILLHKFTDLVASMIGDPLMNQILHAAWNDRPPTEQL